MPPEIRVRVDGVDIAVPSGCSVAAALRSAGIGATRRSADGGARAACCGMGVCFECRVRIDGREQLGCLTRIEAGMEISLDA
jgi:D-hydroxyproline dehydrogenase subunit gamma